MLTLTYDTIAAMRPCWLDERGGERRLRDACTSLGGTFTVVDVLRAAWISTRDRIWVATQKGVLPDSTLRLFAARTARRRLNEERTAEREPDPRSWAAVETAERHARGAATDEELKAAWEAAVDAVAAAARAAPSAVARAARAVARAAADAAWEQAVWAAAWAADAAVAAEAWAADASDAAEAAREAAWEAGCAEPHAQVADLLELLREAEPGDGRED